MIKKAITVKMNEAKDARPIALLVQEANQYQSELYLELDDKKVNAKSIMGMMSLQLCSGETLTLVASGTDEEKAAKGMESFLISSK